MLANCTRCGKLFAALQPGPCPACRDEEEAEFERIRIHLRDHPDHGVAEVAAGTGIPESRILYFLRTGRLRLQGAGTGLSCRLCGVTVESGEICPSCADRMRRRLRPQRGSGATRMYTADRSRRRYDA